MRTIKRIAVTLVLAAWAGCRGEILGAPTAADGSAADASVLTEANPDAAFLLEQPDATVVTGADASVSSDAGAASCGSVGQVITFFESNCAGCHQQSRFPDLTRAGLPHLAQLESRVVPGQRLLVPGDPTTSFLYRKLAHTQGAAGGANMPIGRADTVPELATIEQWIRDGAPTDCPVLPPSSVSYNPNTLDQAALFRCADPTAPRSSPSRLRRTTDTEFTQVTVNAPGMALNPLAPPAGLPYSTYPDRTGMDSATLRLLMMQLPVASEIWSAGDPRWPSGLARMRGISSCCVDRSSVVSCMLVATPTATCIDQYVDTLLRRGSLFRAPAADETTRLRAYLVQQIAAESASGISRHDTLSEIAQAALIMTGSLFRSDVGDPATSRGTERRLSDTELAFALGSVLSDAPVGAPIPESVSWTDDPDAASFRTGRMGLVAQAAADGTIQDATTRISLLRHYGGGISPNRPDVDVGPRASRGDYWLSRRIMGFFREWLDYASANTVFKDHPGATSAFADRGDQYSRTVRGFAHLQSPPRTSGSSEPNLSQQLDDLIARVVIESDTSRQDVFEGLFTTRMAYLQAQPTMNDPVSALWVYGSSTTVAANDAARWTTYPISGPRVGVLTHPAWLAAHGGNFEDDASLVHRGRWIRTELFSSAVGELSDVRGLQAMLGPSDAAHSARARVRRATEPGVDPTAGPDAASGACWSCHRDMNPLGYPFEQFNHAGFERLTDHGGPPDGSTVIDNLPDPSVNGTYANVGDFMGAIAQSRYARRGMIRHAFRYFMGRDERPTDGCTLVEMEAGLDRDGSFFSMLEALISSETFVWRDLNANGGAP